MKRQTSEFEADSLAAARDLLRASFDGNATVVGEQVICDGEPRTLEGVGDTPEAALADARAKVPAGAVAGQHVVSNDKAERTCEVTAYSAEEAANQAPVRPGGKVISVAVKLPGRRGILGLGRTPSTYDVRVLDPAQVNLTIKPKAKIRCELASRDPGDPWREARRVRAVETHDPNKKIIYELQFSKDGHSILVGSGDGSVHILTGDLAVARTMRVASHGSTRFSQHPSGALLVVATGIIGERTISVIDRSTGRTVCTSTLKADWVQYCLDGSIVACGASFWKEVKLLRSDTLEEIAAFPIEGVDCVAMSRDRNLLVCVGDRELGLFDITSQQARWRKPVYFRIKGLAFAPDDQYIVAGCDGNGDVHTYDIQGQQREQFEGKLYVPVSGDGAFSCDGSLVAFPASYGILVCDWKGKRKVELLDTGSLSTVRFAPSGMRLLAGTWAGTVSEWM